MLTSERCSGILSGYWSPAKKDDLVQKLGYLEHQGPKLIFQACAEHCHMQVNAAECSGCPLKKLLKQMNEGGYVNG